MANYLYNRVPLPALPTEHQYNDSGVKLDYAIIKYVQLTGSYKLFFTSQPLRSRYWYGNEQVISTTFPYYWYDYEFSEGNEWEDVYSIQSKPHYADYPDAGLTDLVDGDFFVWTNTDIYNEDGTLYLAASVPVPVPETDHNALIQGWIVGKRLAAQRGRA